MNPAIFRDERVDSITGEGVEDLVVASVVLGRVDRIPWAQRRGFELRVLNKALQVPVAPHFVRIAAEIGNGGRVVEQLMPTDIRQTNEVCQVCSQYLICVLQGDEDVRIEQKS